MRGDKLVSDKQKNNLFAISRRTFLFFLVFAFEALIITFFIDYRKASLAIDQVLGIPKQIPIFILLTAFFIYLFVKYLKIKIPEIKKIDYIRFSSLILVNIIFTLIFYRINAFMIANPQMAAENSLSFMFAWYTTSMIMGLLLIFAFFDYDYIIKLIRSFRVYSIISAAASGIFLYLYPYFLKIFTKPLSFPYLGINNLAISNAGMESIFLFLFAYILIIFLRKNNLKKYEFFSSLTIGLAGMLCVNLFWIYSISFTGRVISKALKASLLSSNLNWILFIAYIIFFEHILYKGVFRKKQGIKEFFISIKEMFKNYAWILAITCTSAVLFFASKPPSLRKVLGTAKRFILNNENYIHFIEYSVLGLLILSTFFFIKKENFKKRYIILAFLATITIAILDELVQYIIVGRVDTGDYYDILIDASGFVFALIIFLAIKPLYHKMIEKN